MFSALARTITKHTTYLVSFSEPMKSAGLISGANSTAPMCSSCLDQDPKESLIGKKKQRDRES